MVLIHNKISIQGLTSKFYLFSKDAHMHSLMVPSEKVCHCVKGEVLQKEISYCCFCSSVLQVAEQNVFIIIKRL